MYTARKLLLLSSKPKNIIAAQSFGEAAMIKFDPLDLDLREREIELPVSRKNPTLGTISIRLREIPFGKWQSLILEANAANVAAANAAEKYRKENTEESSLAFGEALARRGRSEMQLILWGVCNHAGFYSGENAFAFQSQRIVFDGKEYNIAAEKMFRLYSLVGDKNAGGVGSELTSEIASAITRFQEGREQPSADDIWKESAVDSPL